MTLSYATATSRGPAVEVAHDPLPDEQLTELGHCRRLVAVAGHHIRHVTAWRRWLTWDGRRWHLDETGEVARLAKDVARAATQRVAGELAAAVDSEAKSDCRADLRAALRLESSAAVRGTLGLASTELGVAITPDQLDSHRHLLNVANGVLDLSTGDLLDHDRELLLTRLAPAAYRPDAAAPGFKAFLKQVQPQQDMREYLARLLGHTLVGQVVEHLLPVLHGAGANGKSTLLGAVMASLGDYAGTADPALLVDRGHDAHPTGVADLFGRRLAVVHETDQGRQLAEGTVKRLTGGDRVKARRMREDFWEYEPSHTLVMLTNHRPEVRGDDEGIRRRIRLVPFTEAIAPKDQDHHLPATLAGEKDGILACLVAGYGEWRRGGLADPDAVLQATATYRGEQDVLQRFLDEDAKQVVLLGSVSVAGSLLYKAWCTWCAGEGVDAGTNTAFGNALKRKGYTNHKTGGRSIWKGIGLAAPDDDREPR